MRKPRPLSGICNDQSKQLAVAYLPLDKLVPSERNARTHSQEQIKQITASISAFGWTNPILIDEERAIIAGHGRLEAAKAAGLVDVPTITLAGLSAAQKRALAIADNKLALNAGWDDEMLRLELSELGLEGFDISLVGFSELELKDILADRTEGLTDPDDVPEVQADAVTVTGDVWLLGRHRLVCGDCTDAGVVDAVLAGVKPHLMVTDPPYGTDYDPEWRVDRGLSTARRGAVTNDIEISQQYCDVTIQRWQNFTGQTATLDGDGRTFAEIETERRLVNAA